MAHRALLHSKDWPTATGGAEAHLLIVAELKPLTTLLLLMFAYSPSICMRSENTAGGAKRQPEPRPVRLQSRSPGC